MMTWNILVWGDGKGGSQVSLGCDLVLERSFKISVSASLLTWEDEYLACLHLKR